jgi:hypothetical protein
MWWQSRVPFPCRTLPDPEDAQSDGDQQINGNRAADHFSQQAFVIHGVQARFLDSTSVDTVPV